MADGKYIYKGIKSNYEHLQEHGVELHFWVQYVVPGVKHLKGYVCEHCGSKDHLDVHHTDYKNQTIHTLLLLCRSCHRLWHTNNEKVKE